MRFWKRLFDILMALFFIILLSPMYLLLAVLIKIKLKGKVIFKQARVGRYNKIFTLYKFKTMINGKDKIGEGEMGDEKLTPFARFLRHSSLDELPQLFNILRGEMSFIGPRPKTIYESLLMAETSYIYRHAIKPGLTGWSVIHGRNNLANDVALHYDLEHVAKNSFWLDIRVFFKTIILVFKRTGVNAPGQDSFIHLSVFLTQKGYIDSAALQKISVEANDILKTRMKTLPSAITSKDFKRVEKDLRKEKDNFVVRGWTK